MAGSVGVNEGIQTVINNMESSIAAIRGEIQKIEDAADAAKAGWRGDANASFVKAELAWHDEAEKLKTDLTALSSAVTDGKNKLHSMDQQNA